VCAPFQFRLFIMVSLRLSAAIYKKSISVFGVTQSSSPHSRPQAPVYLSTGRIDPDVCPALAS